MITACIAALTLGGCVAARWYLDREIARAKAGREEGGE